MTEAPARNPCAAAGPGRYRATRAATRTTAPRLRRTMTSLRTDAGPSERRRPPGAIIPDRPSCAAGNGHNKAQKGTKRKVKEVSPPLRFLFLFVSFCALVWPFFEPLGAAGGV